MLWVAWLLRDNVQVDLNDEKEQGLFLVVDFQKSEYCAIKLGEKGLEVGGGSPK